MQAAWFVPPLDMSKPEQWRAGEPSGQMTAVPFILLIIKPVLEGAHRAEHKYADWLCLLQYVPALVCVRLRTPGLGPSAMTGVTPPQCRCAWG